MAETEQPEMPTSSGNAPPFIKQEPQEFESDEEDEYQDYDPEDTADESGKGTNKDGESRQNGELIKCEPELPMDCNGSEVEEAEENDKSYEYEKELPCCFLCNGESENSWPPEIGRRRKKIARSVCQLLDMSVENFIDPFYEYPYCSECQERLQKIDTVMTNLGRLKKKICKLKNRFEEDMKKFWVPSDENDIPVAAKEYHKVRKVILREKSLHYMSPPPAPKRRGRKPKTLDQIPIIKIQRLKTTKSSNSASPSTSKAGVTHEESEAANFDGTQSAAAPVDDEMPPSSPEVYDDDKDSDFELDPQQKIKYSIVETRRRGRPRRTRRSAAAVVEPDNDEDVDDIGEIEKKLSKSQSKYAKYERCPEEGCNEIRNKKADLDVHIRRDHLGMDKPYLCKKCDDAFDNTTQLNEHYKTAHPPKSKQLNQCTSCDYVNPSKKAMRAHRQKMHRRRVRHKCNHCEATFTLKHRRDDHEKSEHSGDPNAFFYKCDHCDAQFKTRAATKRHIVLEHDKTFQCKTCGKCFASDSNLHDHVYRNHEDDGSRDLLCPTCGKICKTRQSLRTHQRIHQEKMNCKICNKAISANSMKTHISRHFGQGRVVCDICGRICGSKGRLAIHKRIHTGERPYPCNICGKAFYTGEYLKTHLQYHERALARGKTTLQHYDRKSHDGLMYTKDKVYQRTNRHIGKHKKTLARIPIQLKEQVLKGEVPADLVAMPPETTVVAPSSMPIVSEAPPPVPPEPYSRSITSASSTPLSCNNDSNSVPPTNTNPHTSSSVVDYPSNVVSPAMSDAPISLTVKKKVAPVENNGPPPQVFQTTSAAQQQQHQQQSMLNSTPRFSQEAPSPNIGYANTNQLHATGHPNTFVSHQQYLQQQQQQQSLMMMLMGNTGSYGYNSLPPNSAESSPVPAHWPGYGSGNQQQ